MIPCPLNHEALKDSPRWDTLPSLGIQHGGEHPIDLRNCPECHSTLGRYVLGADTKRAA